MKLRPLPCLEVLNVLLIADGHAGIFLWKERSPDLFIVGKPQSRKRAASVWNSQYAGKPAMTKLGPNGYYYGTILREMVLAHRVMWKMMHGSDPFIIDHINGIRSDNRIANLRNCEHGENDLNVGIRTDNTSGYTGIEKRGRIWIARIRVSGTQKYLGSYRNLEDALRARQQAEKEYGFSSIHGRRPSFQSHLEQ